MAQAEDPVNSEPGPGSGVGCPFRYVMLVRIDDWSPQQFRFTVLIL